MSLLEQRTRARCGGVLMLVVATAALPGCRVTSIPFFGGPPAPEVQCLADVAYYDGPQADDVRHRADLFLPKGKKGFPVVVLVHGGAWMMGDNRCCGLYPAVAQFLAREGIGVVLPNYRLSPSVSHPEHIRDVARAVAWVRRNIAEYGGSPDSLFLAGHSAGGHLVSLLATDERYLKAEGLCGEDIKGVISISGVYDIPPGDLEVRLGGAEDNAFRLEQAAPLRRASGAGPVAPFGRGIPLQVNVYGPAFGHNPLARRDAAPLTHVRPGLPPFLIVSAQHDLPTLRGMAEDFEKALTEKGCAARLLQVEQRNHNSVIFLAVTPEDPVARAMVEFVRAK